MTLEEFDYTLMNLDLEWDNFRTRYMINNEEWILDPLRLVAYLKTGKVFPNYKMIDAGKELGMDLALILAIIEAIEFPNTVLEKKNSYNTYRLRGEIRSCMGYIEDIR